MKSIYLPSAKHVYGTKISIPSGPSVAVHPKEYLKIRKESQNSKKCMSSRLLGEELKEDKKITETSGLRYSLPNKRQI